MKRVLKKIKTLLTQLLAFILAFFKDTNLVYVKKVTVRKKIVDPEKVENKKEMKEQIVTSTSDTTPIPDEVPPTLEIDTEVIKEEHVEDVSEPIEKKVKINDNNHIINDDKLNYKQSIANVTDDIKDKVISKIKGKEIYFSELIVLNTIIEAVEEKNNFKYEKLKDDKKEKIKPIIEEINKKISPTLKKEMNNNRIKTKEDLKKDIVEKIDSFGKYNKRIKEIVKKEEKEVVKEITTEPIVEVSKEVIEKKIGIENKKEEIIEIVKDGKDEKDSISSDFISIEERNPDKDNIIVIEKVDKDKDKEEAVTINKKKPIKESLIKIEKDLNPDDDLISIVKADKVEPRERVYFIADLLSTRRDMKVKDTVKTNTSNTIVNDVKKEIAENIQDKSKKLPFVMVPNEKETKEEIEEKIRNTEVTPTLVVNDEKEEDLYKELDEDIVKDLDRDIEEDELISAINNKEELERDIIKLQESIIKVSELKDEVTNTEKEEFDDNNKVIEDKEKDDIEDIKEEKSSDKVIAIESKTNVDATIKKLSDKVDVVIEDTKAEIIKENLEDKDYERCEKQIDDLLLEINQFLNTNRIKMLEKDIKKLKGIKNSLLDIKDKLNNQKKIDIETEKAELEDKIKEEEILKLQQEIKKLHLEHQTEIDDEVLKKLKQMEENNDPKLEEFETALIKKKLKRTSKLLEIPTLLALPFVRNKYFLYFTAGMLINNHFDFINAIFRRKEKRYEAIDLTPIKNGKKALEESLDLTYRNLIYLDVIEEEALTKYPNLINDDEFVSYIERIRNKLTKNYERLEKKQKMIDKYIYKVNKKNKVLKKYKLLKDKEAA